jgi:DnaK suppressor protein
MRTNATSANVTPKALSRFARLVTIDDHAIESAWPEGLWPSRMVFIRWGMAQEPSPLDQSQLTTAREMLAQKRDELRHAITGLREPAPVGEPGDLADLATTEIATAERTELATQERALLAEVEHALGKLDAGTYGISEATGEPIRWARLRALPWARNDVDETAS